MESSSPPSSNSNFLNLVVPTAFVHQLQQTGLLMNFPIVEQQLSMHTNQIPTKKDSLSLGPLKKKIPEQRHFIRGAVDPGHWKGSSLQLLAKSGKVTWGQLVEDFGNFARKRGTKEFDYEDYQRNGIRAEFRKEGIQARTVWSVLRELVIAGIFTFDGDHNFECTSEDWKLPETSQPSSPQRDEQMEEEPEEDKGKKIKKRNFKKSWTPTPEKDDEKRKKKRVSSPKDSINPYEVLYRDCSSGKVQWTIRTPDGNFWHSFSTILGHTDERLLLQAVAAFEEWCCHNRDKVFNEHYDITNATDKETEEDKEEDSSIKVEENDKTKESEELGEISLQITS